MLRLMSLKWVLAVAFFASFATSGIASAQFGIGFGRGGYGGYYGPGPYASVYGGYGGFGPYNAGYPGYAFGNPGYGFGNYGLGNSIGIYGYGNGFSYAQPIYSSFNQPLYSSFNQPLYSNRFYTAPIYAPRVVSVPVYSPRVYSPGIDASSLYGQSAYGTTIYSGSSSVATSSPTLGSSPRVISSQPAVKYDNGEIVLFSPPTNSREISYTLNGASYTMKPGTLQKFTNDRKWVIEVNLGNGEMTQYTLSTGRYKFKQSETGFHLYTTRDDPQAPVAAPVPAPAPVPEPDTSLNPVAVPPSPVPMPGE